MNNHRANKFLNIVAILAICLVSFGAVIYPTLLRIYERFNTEPHLFVHDNPVQLEEAIKFILKGKNPYTENYFGTPLENWPYGKDPVNPALYHFVTLPFHFLFSLPFFLVSNFLIGWFDQRFVYIFSFILTFVLILKWPNKSIFAKFVFLALLAINPLFKPFFIEGRNDIFMFSLVVLSVYLLELKKINYSSLVLALAVASKQSTWFILPFYFAYLYYKQKDKSDFFIKVKNIVKQAAPFFITLAIIVVPFLLWDLNSFFDDTIKYPAGTSSTGNYPIKGIGIQQLVLDLGLVGSRIDYWPFWIPEIIFILPLLFILLKFQKINNSLGQMFFNYSLLILAFWFFSRFFNDNYLGFVIMLLALAVFTHGPIGAHKAFNK